MVEGLGAVQEQTETDQDTLKRIVATLMALAVLAERAGGMCRPVRCLVLWILRAGETIVCEFVEDITHTSLPAVAGFPAMRCGDNATDAIRLAMRLRVLAAALTDMLNWEQSLQRRAILHPELSDNGGLCLPARWTPLTGPASFSAIEVFSATIRSLPAWEPMPVDTS